QQLASMLGWRVESPPDAASDREPVVDHSTTADLATYRPEHLPPVAEEAAPEAPGTRTETEELAFAEAAPPVERDQEPPAPRRAAPGAATTELSAPPRQPHARARQAPAVAPARPRRKRRRLQLLIVGIPLLLLVAAGSAGAAYYYVLTATVGLTPAERTISVDLVYGLARPNTKYDLTAEPTPVSHTVPFTKTIATTGKRTEPDATAGGTLQLLNPTIDVVTVPSGTTLQGTNGVDYVIDADVAVPAADPFGTSTLGSALAKIHAANPGSGGNLEAGGLAGQLKSGIYYKNANAISGGTDKAIAVVTQADLDALNAAALDDLKANAEPAFKQSLDPNVQLVPNSEQLGEPQLSFSHKAGEDADQVAVTASQTISGQVFDPTKLTTEARDEVGRRLTQQVGNDVVLLGDTLTIGQPRPLEDGTSYTIRAEGRVRQIISAQTQQSLAGQLAGKRLADAEAIVQGAPGVAAEQITIKPDWLPGRLPQLAKNIRIVVNGSSSGTTGP
ncbi:MAG TPA: hypothetical protein VFI42_06940, partial [Thermomicrobiaceae bacterium]|nr:hypothetical protein [Thermomicrobiaceae bacterium]